MEEPNMEQAPDPQESRSHAEEDPATPLFEVKKVARKGRGLIAMIDIPEYTRVLCEKPMLTASASQLGHFEQFLASKLASLPKKSQEQFGAMHNSFPMEQSLTNVFRSNALPCGTSPRAAVYATACFINHSCVPNCHMNWNRSLRHMTIHAMKPIRAGQEITISYRRQGPPSARRAFLKEMYGFDCRCRLCRGPRAAIKASTDRWAQLEMLEPAIEDEESLGVCPNQILSDCRRLLRVVAAEFGGLDGPLNRRINSDAFLACVAHGDLARASLFAARAYITSKACAGDDDPLTQELKTLALQPGTHLNYGAISLSWRRARGDLPRGLSTLEFEDWLFRERGSDWGLKKVTD